MVLLSRPGDWIAIPSADRAVMSRHRRDQVQQAILDDGKIGIMLAIGPLGPEDRFYS